MELFNDHFQNFKRYSIPKATLAAWALTFGEDNTIQWCLYQGEKLWGRFINKDDALHYLDEISKGPFKR